MFTILYNGSIAGHQVLHPLLKPAGRKKKILLMVNLGTDPVGEGYVRVVSQKACQLGLELRQEALPGNLSFSEVKKRLFGLMKETAADGLVLNFSPRAKASDRREELVGLVPPELDADYLSPRFLANRRCQPSVVRAVLRALEEGAANSGLKDRSEASVVVLGSRGFWGKRIMAALPTVGWKQVMGFDKLGRTEKNICRQAEVIISCVGKPGLVDGTLVSSGSVLIDVGYSFLRGESRGDVELESVEGKAAFVTPVPGGIGPLSVAYLFDNFLRSRRKHAGKDQ